MPWKGIVLASIYMAALWCSINRIRAVYVSVLCGYYNLVISLAGMGYFCGVCFDF